MSLARRRFDPTTVAADAGRRRVHRFACAECPAVFDMSANTFGGARAHEDITRTMGRRGWKLGADDRHDLCPDCAAARRKARRDAGAGGEKSKEPEMQNTSTAPAAAAPPVMGIDDALVIAEKLGEVYAGRDKGYSDGWTDKRVAEELGVPRDWVRQIREKRFGPSGASEEIRAAVDEARAGQRAAAELLEAVTKERRTLAALNKQVAEQIERFEAQWAARERAIAATIDRIERRIIDIEKAVR